jgi:prepilin-type N-terminal cleavage/methylation domain-containing protein
MQKNRAFTLIELLVVIAIIAILAAIVLISLNSAQNRAKDARVSAGMNQIRTAAESYKSTNGAYAAAMYAGGTDIATIEADLEDASVGSTVEVRVDADGGGYCAFGSLISTPAANWCVDSDLTSARDDDAVAACAAACEAANTCSCD